MKIGSNIFRWPITRIVAMYFNRSAVKNVVFYTSFSLVIVICTSTTCTRSSINMKVKLFFTLGGSWRAERNGATGEGKNFLLTSYYMWTSDGYSVREIYSVEKVFICHTSGNYASQ
jgi:hypothetical protein